LLGTSKPHPFAFIKQTVGEDEVEDPNEWLSVDIGDILEVNGPLHEDNVSNNCHSTLFCCVDLRRKPLQNSRNRNKIKDKLVKPHCYQ